MDYYGTAAGFRAYHTARGRDMTAYASDPTVEAALLVSSEWLDGRYRGVLGGLKVGGREQVRECPRYNWFDVYGKTIASDSVPREMEYAAYEAALKQLVKPGALSIDFTPSKYKRASVDGAVSAEFATFNTSAEAQTKFAVIEQILSPILTGNLNGAGFSSLSGGTTRV
jgi:hypothetical protein